MTRRLVFVALALALAFGAASFAVSLARTALSPLNTGPAATQSFAVEPGETLGSIAARLEAEGILRSATAFKALTRWRAEESALQVGEYALAPSLSADEILATIVNGRVVTYTVSIPEGFTMLQIAERVAAAELAEASAFLEVTRSAEVAAKLGVEGNTLEGYLFPETYRIPRGLPATEVVRILTREFQRAWKKVEAAAAKRNMSMRDVIILASIVEKETAAPKERPRIASVFHNRLEKNIRLATDPTVIYGIANFDGNLKRRHLEDPSNPYNTYKHPGLPPGPISNPGEAALIAVVEPEDSDYLFFVSKNDGTHIFSKTYAEHERAVDYYQRRRRSR